MGSVNGDADTHKSFSSFGTNAIHVGQDPDQWKSKAVIPLISLSTTFKQEAPGKHSGYEYGRSGNPTRDVAEKCYASLENGKHGLLFASGLAATVTITHLLKSGDHILAMDDLYGGSNRYFNSVAAKFGIEVDLVDATKSENVQNALRPNTKMIWIETPTNPMMQIADIEAIAAIARAHNDCILVTDNTFSTCYFQRPLNLGSHLVFNSVTKYLNGHSDVVMGAIATNDDKLAEQLRFLQYAMGAVPSPFDCYLMNRGMKTLHLRMKQHMINGLAVAKFLESSPHVVRVLCPGLPSHPQYELVKRQMCGGNSGMLSFWIKGDLNNATCFLSSLKVFILAESLGGFESLAEHPAIMTHASVPEDQRKKLGISDTLIRLSVGLEEVDDLIQDLTQALETAAAI